MSNKVPQLRFNGYSDAWVQRNLSDLATFSKGKGYSKSDLVSDGFPAILYGRMYTNYESQINDVSDTFVADVTDAVLSQTGDVIVPGSGETPEDIARASNVNVSGVVLGGDINIIRPDAEKMDSTFLALTISNGQQQTELIKRAQGKSVVHLHNSDLKKVNVVAPSKDEQRAISSLFNQLDNLIAANQRKLDLLKEQKKGYLQKMFPKNGAKVPEFRFAGFADDWEERKLGEVGKTKSGIGFPDAQQGGKQGTPFYKVSDMNNPGNEVVMMNANNYASDSQLKENKWNPINPQNSGVVFAKVGAAIFLDRKRIVDTSFLIDNNMMSYLFDPSWNRYFGKTLFEKLRLSRFAQVGALPSFNGSDVEDIKVMIPEESEQKMIGDMFEKLDDIIALHQRKLDLLKEQRKGFLQKMFV